MRIAVVGAGAIGANVGGLLFETGHDITLIDQWPEHVDAVNQHGLHLGGTISARSVSVPALHIHELQAVEEPFEAIFLAVKSYDTEWATMFARAVLQEPDGYIVSLQNGINEPVISGIVGPGRTLGCVVTIAAELSGPGSAIRTDAVSGYNNMHFTVGELDGVDTVRVRRLVEMLEVVGPAKSTSNLVGMRWSKLAANCMINSLGALTGFVSGDLFVDDRTRAVAMVIAAEAVRVAGAAGHDVEPIVGIAAARFVDAVTDSRERAAVGEQLALVGAAARTRGGRSSALQDVLRGRRTEIAYLNGTVAREGARMGVPTPMNDALVQTFDGLGLRFTPDVGHLEPLTALLVAGSWA